LHFFSSTCSGLGIPLITVNNSQSLHW
jgi:hypothetical protein